MQKVLFALVLSAALAAPALSAELLINGNFETGTFAGWTNATLPSSRGNRSIDAPGTNTPLGNLPTAANPLGGSFYAVSSQTGPGGYAMSQAFTLAANTGSAQLSFQMFNRNTNTNTTINPAGITLLSGTNQHARVDILTAVASAFSTLPGDIVASLFLGADPGTGVQPWKNYSFDLLGLGLTAGGSYQLRFAQVDNVGFFNQGVDNVSITTTAVPEPASWALMITGFGLVGAAARRRRGSAVIA